MSGMEKWEHLMISFAHIKDATNDFEKTIGKGGYGSVYQGELFINGRYIKVAVKRLNDQFGQGLKEFLTEIQLLSGQQHENIITLVGYCDEGNEKIIVYEYAEQGSLDQYIRPSHTNHSLTWLERLKIVAGAARGLDHLHNHVGEHKTVIHRDIKSSNILLDHNWVAKISDFGLSKLAFSGLGASTVISEACGTVNYLEPEYIRTGIVTKKTDVFSFGMVLFEVLCGRLCYVRDADGILLLADVAKEYYANDNLDKIIDPILREQMSPEPLKKYSAIAYKCLQDREHRPLMGVVKKELEETLKIQMGTYYNDGDSRLSELYNSDIELLGDDKKSFSDPLIQYDGPRSGNDNDDYVEITLDVSDDTVAVHRVKTVGGEDVENPELFLSKRQPVSRLDRTKSSAALALKELQFIGNNRNSWAEVERRFDVLTEVTNGLLPRSLFSECIGMNKESKEFAGVLFDALSRRRNITGDVINKEQLYEFWDQISDQSFDSRLQTFFDMINTDGDGRIKEDQVREIISLSASANKLSNIQQQADEYAALIMEELDPDNLGYIMIENLEMLLLQASTHNVRGESRNLSVMSSQQPKMTRHKNPIKRWYEDFKNRK